jgi:hypothetical protein
LSTTASFLNLSGFATLREIPEEEFFTPRREDAKEVFKSKSPVPLLNLGGFAPLRETSVTQGRGKFFTLRRQGAKKAFKPKSLISSPDLSGFAPLRETSPKPWQP